MLLPLDANEKKYSRRIGVPLNETDEIIHELSLDEDWSTSFTGQKSTLSNKVKIKYDDQRGRHWLASNQPIKTGSV
jgi:hypothetical protein